MTTPRYSARRRQRSRDDRGYILAAAIITLTLLAIASALTARVFAELLAASATERLAISHTAAARTARTTVDAWMADPAVSRLLTGTGPGRGAYVGVWFTDAAAGCVPDPHTACWQITAVDVTDDTAADPGDRLRGGTAVQELAAVGVRVVAGCINHEAAACRIGTTAARTYERTVFAHYQIHYSDNTTLDNAFEALETEIYGPDGPDDPTACAQPADQQPAGTVCDDNPDHPHAHRLGLKSKPGAPVRVVFTTDDTLNGPLRHSGPSSVLYCGSPTFASVETRTAVALQQVTGCTATGAPKWATNEQTTHRDDTLALPSPEAPPTTDCTEPAETAKPPRTARLAKIHHSLRQSAAADTARAGGCPGEPDSNSHFIRPGDIITNSGDITIEHLAIEGSVTVHAGGDIIICGDIKADKTNPAGGPNVIALIAGGDVVIAPGIANKQCEDPDAAPPSAVSATGQSMQLTNVAILAPNGGVYTKRWYLPHGDVPPSLTIKGSIAAKHLGLYGIPDPTAGNTTHGWRKNFSYPTEFWLARPPRWPNLPPGEWTHLR